MTKYYDLGNIKASITKESDDRFFVKIKESGTEYPSAFKSEARALMEILSYAEIDAEDF